MTLLILTLVGPDRPGLVNEVSRRVAAHGGNWLESRMARLAGQFAGIVLVEIAEAKEGELAASLRELEPRGLQLVVRTATPQAESEIQRRLLLLEVIGQDRPGIVDAITRILGAHAVNIEELTTKVISGSFSGEVLFQATARLRVPDAVDQRELQSELERLGDELMVEIRVAAEAEATG